MVILAGRAAGIGGVRLGHGRFGQGFGHALA
jgi:hypothetical protein